jgi:hypothetical protein
MMERLHVKGRKPRRHFCDTGGHTVDQDGTKTKGSNGGFGLAGTWLHRRGRIDGAHSRLFTAPSRRALKETG